MLLHMLLQQHLMLVTQANPIISPQPLDTRFADATILPSESWKDCNKATQHKPTCSGFKQQNAQKNMSCSEKQLLFLMSADNAVFTRPFLIHADMQNVNWMSVISNAHAAHHLG